MESRVYHAGQRMETVARRAPWFPRPGAFPIEAYSEFVPPPHLGPKPYGTTGINPMPDGDPFGWDVTEYEEAFELRPGLEMLAHGRVAGAWPISARATRPTASRAASSSIIPTGPRNWRRRPASCRTSATSCCCRWPCRGRRTTRAASAGRFSAAASRGRNAASGRASSRHRGRGSAGGDGASTSCAACWPRSTAWRCATRITFARPASASCPASSATPSPGRRRDPLPAWTGPTNGGRAALEGVKYLLTFRPFGKLPQPVRRAYLAGDLHLLPVPGQPGLLGHAVVSRMQRQLPFAIQIPLLHLFHRHEDPHGIRVPQSGWMHEPRPGQPGPGPAPRPAAQHLQAQPPLAARPSPRGRVGRPGPRGQGGPRPVQHVGGRPRACTASRWPATPRSGRTTASCCSTAPARRPGDLRRPRRAARGACSATAFSFRPMRVGRYEVYWHRPLAAYLSSQTKQPTLSAVGRRSAT